MDSNNNEFLELINRNNVFSGALRKMMKYLESKNEAQKGAVSKTKKNRKQYGINK
jgi:hypothetical protein